MIQRSLVPSQKKCHFLIDDIRSIRPFAFNWIRLCWMCTASDISWPIFFSILKFSSGFGATALGLRLFAFIPYIHHNQLTIHRFSSWRAMLRNSTETRTFDGSSAGEKKKNKFTPTCSVLPAREKRLRFGSASSGVSLNSYKILNSEWYVHDVNCNKSGTSIGSGNHGSDLLSSYSNLVKFVKYPWNIGKNIPEELKFINISYTFYLLVKSSRFRKIKIISPFHERVHVNTEAVSAVP